MGEMNRNNLIKRMLTIDLMKIEFKININKKVILLTSNMFKIIKIALINKAYMKICLMMNSTNKKMKFKHQKIPVDLISTQISKAMFS